MSRPLSDREHWYPAACLRCGAPLPGRPDAQRALEQLLRLLPHYSRDAIAAQLREMVSTVRGYCCSCAQAPAHGRCPCGAEATTVIVRLDSGGELYSCDSCELTRPLPAQVRFS